MSQQPEYDAIKKQLEILDLLLAGKLPALSADAANAMKNDSSSALEATQINEFELKFRLLITLIAEIRNFMQALCQGDLDATVPGRRNYLAAPIKELHTQLASLTWSMEQLAKGNVVSRLYYPGVLFESFNSLIEKVASVSNRLETAQNYEQEWEWSVNSWRYHQLLAALNNLHIMVLEVALDGRIVYANRPAKEYFGENDFLADTSKDERQYTRVLENYLTQIGNEGDNGVFPKFREIFDEKKNCWYKITSDRVEFTDKRSGYLHMIDNISEWKNHEKTLKQTAITDPLTGLYNRGYGLQALAEAIIDAKSGAQYCAAFMDLDGLKAINDKFGHTNGDYAICAIADAFVSSVRDNRDIVCRFGGDEFIIIFKNCNEQTAIKAISRMNEKLDEINRMHDKGFNLAFSHGVVEIDSTRENDVFKLIEEIDQIMYKNKEARKRALKQATPYS